MSHELWKNSASDRKPVTYAHGVKFLGFNPLSTTPSRVTRSTAAIASLESPGPTSRTRRARTKVVVIKNKKPDPVQVDSEDSASEKHDNADRVPDVGIDQDIDQSLGVLADAATGPNVAPNVETQGVEPNLSLLL